MRRTAVLVMLALFAGLLLVGTVSAATPQQQINQLKRQLGKLQTQVNSLKAEQACYDTLWAFSQFGDADNGTYGYLWGETDGTVFATTALDLFDPSQGVADRDFSWFVSYNGECAAAALQRRAFGKHLGAARPVAAKTAPRILRQSRWHW